MIYSCLVYQTNRTHSLPLDIWAILALLVDISLNFLFLLAAKALFLVFYHTSMPVLPSILFQLDLVSVFPNQKIIHGADV